MGCDIHLAVEHKIDGVWQQIDPPDDFPRDPIVLLGMDGCYEGRNRYYWQFPNQPKAVEYNNRIFSSPNRGLLRDKPVDNHCVAYDLYWNHFAEMNPSLMQGRILNASGGIVEVFPRISLSEVIKTYGNRKKYAPR
jgi:hypothetical protein